MTKTAKLLGAFEKGDALTAKQITARFGLVNPQDSIKNLREEGYAIYGNEVTNSKGSKVTQYRLGKPSRRMVAAAAKQFGATIFSR